MHYVYLGIAILCEVIATSSLKASDSFRRPGPSLLVVVGYASAFYLLTLCLNKMSVGVVYAIWSGLGIVLVALAGVVLYKQKLDAAALVGMALIVAGVLVMNLLSKSVTH